MDSKKQKKIPKKGILPGYSGAEVILGTEPADGPIQSRAAMDG